AWWTGSGPSRSWSRAATTARPASGNRRLTRSSPALRGGGTVQRRPAPKKWSKRSDAGADGTRTHDDPARCEQALPGPRGAERRELRRAARLGDLRHRPERV